MNTMFSKWRDGLAKTSKATFGQIATILGAAEITEDIWDDLEALLIQADVGVETTIQVLDRLEDRVDQEGMTRNSEVKAALRQELRRLLIDPPPLELNQKP